MSKRIVLVTAIVMLAFFALACDIPALWGEGDDDHIEQRMRMENAAERESTAGSSSNDDNARGLPEITLTYTATNPMDLPVYKASLSHPILVDTDGAGPHRAFQNDSRSEDAEGLGSIQPGTVTQTSTFEGTWDPATGVLSGTVTHTYTSSLTADGEYLASRTEYSMSGTLEARLVEGTRRIEGTVVGPDASATTTVDGGSSGPTTQTWPVNWTVFGELPEGI